CPQPRQIPLNIVRDLHRAAAGDTFSDERAGSNANPLPIRNSHRKGPLGMFTRRRRLLGMSMTVAVMAALAAAARPNEPPTHIFRGTLRLKDSGPAGWSGKAAVEGGKVTVITGWRFEGKDAVDGTTGWHCSTHNLIAPEKRFPILPASGKPKPPELKPWPNGVTLSVTGNTPTVTLTL